MSRLLLRHQFHFGILGVRCRRGFHGLTKFTIQMRHSLIKNLINCLVVSFIDHLILDERETMSDARCVSETDADKLVLLLHYPQPCQFVILCQRCGVHG